jgi:hypothetical protein
MSTLTRIASLGLVIALIACGDPSDDDDHSSDDDSGAPSDDDSAAPSDDDDDDTEDTIRTEIDVVGGEVAIGVTSGFRSITIDVDLAGQPHVIVENYTAGLCAYHKLGGDWQAEEPWFVPGGAMGSVHMEIDASDRAWVSFTTFLAGDADVTGEWVSLLTDMSHAPTQAWAENIRPYTGFSGNLSIDPYYPDDAVRMGGQPHPTYRFDAQGNYEQDITLSPGDSGEGIRFRIAPAYGGSQPGVWHAATGIWNLGGNDGGYHNTTRLGQSLGPIAWLSHTYPQWGDSHYPSVGVDLEDPQVAYLAGSYEGLLINIFDGEQMMFPIDAAFQVAPDIAEYGNGVERFTPIWAAARGGGSFLCWTGADGQVKLTYVSPLGPDHFGPITDVGPGSRCAIATDDTGDLHMAYDNGGVRYRFVTTR